MVAPNEVPKPELAACVVAVAEDKVLVVSCPNGEGAVVPAGICPKTGAVEGVAVVSPADWLNAEPEEVELVG